MSRTPTTLPPLASPPADQFIVLDDITWTDLVRRYRDALRRRASEARP
jgi:hypothetical protein